MGFCEGVRRSIALAVEAARDAGAKVVCFGPLIHNEEALKRLESLGVSFVREDAPPEMARGAVALIRSHGIEPSRLAALSELASKIVDTTCPRVAASQRIARRASNEGKRLVIAGDPSHGEVKGIAGHARACHIASSARSLEGIDLGPGPVLIAQSTFGEEAFAAIAAELLRLSPDAEIHDTICRATKERREALRELAGRVDALVIVGSQSSANSRGLLALAESLGKPAWLVANAGELPREVFAHRRGGVSAGASAPDWIIDAIERRLKEGS